MLKRLYIAIFVISVLWAIRVYLKVSADRVPATAPAARPATPARETASAPAAEPTERPKPVRTASLAKPLLSKSDLAPEAILERKRRGARVVGTDDPAASPLARYAKLRQTRKVRVGQRGYLILGARAVRPENYRADLGPVVFEENDLRIVEYGRDGWDQLTTSAEAQPLMVNPSNGRLALVTGAIQVSVGDVAQAERIAAAENLTLINYDRSIGVAFLKAPADYALLPALGRIAAQPGVGQVELETVESRKAAR